ncbi:hypothetical protein MK396_03240 [Streptococcus oralis]|uniref:hypothetical protein n=1 Tax=Streptococcus oralis TaxID=1303 RepID=UPI0022846569|nr:hypothetical protein [Streptococcus oralis]MCY7084372.1 hypothetical protein [Streptococcus oralis]
MITDKSFNYLVDQVYEVDKNKNSTPWKAGDELRKDSQSFRVLSAKDNTSKGMQSRSGLNSAKVVDSQFVMVLDYANVS